MEAWRSDLGKLNQVFADTLVKEGKEPASDGGAAVSRSVFGETNGQLHRARRLAAIVNIPSEVRMTLRIVDGQARSSMKSRRR